MIRTSRGGNGSWLRILFGLAIAAFSLFSYFGSQQYNDVTGENQYVSITPRQEIALGLRSAPQLIREYGGEYRDRRVQDTIDAIGFNLVNNSVAADTPWDWEFTVLNSGVVNAFALPGGQVFITAELLAQLETEDAVAGVLAHEIVHVLARHGAQQLAQSELTNGLVGAVGVASGRADAAQTAAIIAQLVNLQYGRDDEIESDTLGVCIMWDAGYDPQGMVDVQRTLAAVGSGSRPPEFFSTHPDPGNRIREIEGMLRNISNSCSPYSVNQ